MSGSQLNRRQFLVGAGGWSLALPFLESLAPSSAFAQSTAPIKRFVAIIAPNGYHEPVYYPSVEADTRLSDHIFYKKLTSIQGPLSECLGTKFDALRPKMNILRGLDIAGAFGHSLTSALCSSRRLVNGDNNPIEPVGNSRSIDVVLGLSKSFYPTAPRFKALRAAQSVANSYSLDKDSLGNTVRIPYTPWPFDMFQQVFGGLDLTPSAAAALQSKKATIGDLVLKSYKSLLGDRRISSTDKNIVTNFVDQIQELNKRVNTAPVSCAAPNVTKAKSPYHDSYTDAEKDELMYQFIDIMMAAFACDLTRVAVISLVNDNYRHGVSHENYFDRESNLRFVGIMQKYQNSYVERFASRMNSVVESNGKTMLDNSLLFWGMEQSAGNAHCSVSMPAITFGSLGGAIKTDYYVDYRQRPFKYYASRKDIFPAFGSESYNQLMNTIFQGLGVPPSEYEQYGDGGGFGSFDTNNIMQYLQGEYDSMKTRRKSTLPFISLV